MGELSEQSRLLAVTKAMHLLSCYHTGEAQPQGPQLGASWTPVDLALELGQIRVGLFCPQQQGAFPCGESKFSPKELPSHFAGEKLLSPEWLRC